MKRNTRGYLLPETIDPIDSYCITVQVPKDDLHVAAFMGAVEQLAIASNWDWDGQQSGKAVADVWRVVVNQLKDNFIEGCMDCDGTEDCLETSATIIILEDAIVNNEADIVININEISENSDDIINIVENPPDGSTYPDEPIRAAEPDPSCGASYYCVQKLRDWVVEVEAYPASEPTILDAMEAALLGELSLSFSIVIALLENVYTIPEPDSILTDFDAQVDDMRAWLYCEGFDKPAFEAYVRATLTNGEAIADYIAGIAFVSWQQWYTIGRTDLTQNCSAYLCGWVNTFDFTISGYEFYAWISGTYTEVGGSYVAGVGWESSVIDNGAGGYNSVLNIRLDYPSAVTITRVLVEFTALVGGASGIHQTWLKDATSTVWLESLPTSVGGHSEDFTGLSVNSVRDMRVALHDVDENRTFRITKIVLEGVGIDPEFGV